MVRGALLTITVRDAVPGAGNCFEALFDWEYKGPAPLSAAF